jgi:hypothetical protein
MLRADIRDMGVRMHAGSQARGGPPSACAFQLLLLHAHMRSPQPPLLHLLHAPSCKLPSHPCMPLRLHADKNADRLDEAQERFKEVQNAYEILSDKHERAWYDGHRDQILRSGERHQAGATGFDAGGAGSRPDDEEDLYPYFNSSCYSGYGEGPKVRRRKRREEGGTWRERAVSWPK